MNIGHKPKKLRKSRKHMSIPSYNKILLEKGVENS